MHVVTYYQFDCDFVKETIEDGFYINPKSLTIYYTDY
jgi:hypothetical protein